LSILIASCGARKILSPLALLFAILACSRAQQQIVVITATPVSSDILSTSSAISRPSPIAFSTSIVTPDPPRAIDIQSRGRDYVVQAGDTLFSIGLANSVSMEELQELNNLDNPDNLSIGQIIRLPDLPDEKTSNFKIMPDAKFVQGPGSQNFDVGEFIGTQPGFIRIATDQVNGDILTATEIIERVALSYSIDARILLALLEYESQWLSQSNQSQQAQLFPIISPENVPDTDLSGLFRQLSWTANQLNHGYYGWKYRGLLDIELNDGSRLLFDSGLNAGTVGLQYLLSKIHDAAQWHQSVSPSGFYRTYVTYFGNPFIDAYDPLIPANLLQPELSLPFAAGEVWFYTGGPHGGWNNGSAWSAVDFAPPNEPNNNLACYVSQYSARAVASGIVAYSADGIVMLDLDHDGDISTGWVIFYLHLADEGRVGKGTQVEVGDSLGHPSCAGGFSNATHLHIARKYNGEWIPAFCHECSGQHIRPTFTMSGWSVIGLRNQEYQGFLVRGDVQLQAEQSLTFPNNRISS